MTAHAFGCGGDAGCNCGAKKKPCCGSCARGGPCEGESVFSGGTLGAGTMDPMSLIMETGASFLPIPGPLRDAAVTAARQMVNPDMLPPEVQATLERAQREAEAQAAAAAAAASSAAATVRPRLRFKPKPRMKRSTKVALAVGGGALVVAGVAAKVLL